MIMEQFSDRNRFTATEQQIIDFILEHPAASVNLSLQDLSEACFASQASILRLVKKLGSKGYADFRVKLAQELTNYALTDGQVPVDIPIEPGSNSQDIAKIMYNLSRQSLETTYQELDVDAVKKAAAMLSTAKMIRLFGRGESLIIAEDFHYKLLRLGYNSVLDALNGFQDVFTSHPEMGSGTVALVISQYCNSRHTNYIFDELMAAHTPTILVTAAANAWPYDRFAEVTLRISNAESRYKMGSFSSRTAFLYLMDCLFGQLFSLRYYKNVENLEKAADRRAAREYFYHAEEKRN